MCRSRRELSNAYLLAKFGFDTAENEPSKVCRRSPSTLWPRFVAGSHAAELAALLDRFLVGAPEKDRKSIAREIDPERFGDVLNKE